jgi:hypothetical protein
MDKPAPNAGLLTSAEGLDEITNEACGACGGPGCCGYADECSVVEEPACTG